MTTLDEFITQLALYGNFRETIGKYEIKVNKITRDSTKIEWFNVMVNCMEDNTSVRWHHPYSNSPTILKELFYTKVKPLLESASDGSLLVLMNYIKEWH